MSARYESPVNSQSLPQFGGNISEWQWGRGNLADKIYSFAYDALSRIISGTLIGNADGNDAFAEKDITYDRNGNILTLKRFGENGIIADIVNILTGNRITSNTYDDCGNVTYDSASGTTLEWNSIGLIKKVSAIDGTLVNYSYLADGTKISALDDQGNGLEYRGSLTFRLNGSSLSDYGARQYSASTGRWLAMDPLAEKYYPVSPYAFCNNNPVNLVDPDGRFPDAIWDVASIGIGIHNLIDNIQSGNIRGAIGDGVGIAVDAIAAAVPLIPGGVGAIRAGAKIANTVDNAADAARTAEAISDGKVYATYIKVNPKTGEVYSGRASGYGTPTEVVAKRDRSHHMNEKGFEKAELDKYSTNYDAIRGREQYLIELNGGTKSQGGSSGNAINGVSPTNPNRQRYEDARRKEFGK